MRKLIPHDRHPIGSGQTAVYVKDPKTGRVCRATYKCACHGREFETRVILRTHLAAFKKAVRTDFANLVRTGNLGQEAWMRLPGEPPLQYKRFMSYLNSLSATLTRSIERTAAITGVDKPALQRTSSRWHWGIRADLFDRHIEAQELEEFENYKRRSARKQASVGRKLQEVALSAATRLLGNEERLDEMSGNEIAKLADVGTKIERLANMDPTAISEDRGQVRLVWEGPRPAWAPPQIEGTIDA